MNKFDLFMQMREVNSFAPSPPPAHTKQKQNIWHAWLKDNRKDLLPLQKYIFSFMVAQQIYESILFWPNNAQSPYIHFVDF